MMNTNERMMALLAKHRLCWGGTTPSGYLYCLCDEWEFGSTHEAHVAVALAEAGFGDVTEAVVACVRTTDYDSEAHARWYNEGFDAAMAQQLAPEDADHNEWLERQEAEAARRGWTQGWLTGLGHSRATHPRWCTTLDAVRALEAVRALAEKWGSCWCPAQRYPDEDNRVQDCPRHGDSTAQHMAEGIVTDLRAVLDRSAP